MSRTQKTALLLTQASHSGWLYLTSRQPSAPAGNGCAGGTGSGAAPRRGTRWCAHMASSTGWETLSPFPSGPLLGKCERAAQGSEEGKKPTPMFPVNSAKGKLKTS